MNTQTRENFESQYQALESFIKQRPGFCSYNYSTRAQYEQDARPVRKQKNEALRLLACAKARGIDLTTSAGRLTISKSGAVDYITGQYFPTEYRRAAIRLLEQKLLEDGFSESGIEARKRGV